MKLQTQNSEETAQWVLKCVTNQSLLHGKTFFRLGFDCPGDLVNHCMINTFFSVYRLIKLQSLFNFVFKMEDGQCGKRPKWKTTKMEDNQQRR